MTPEELQRRFKQYALRVIKLVASFPKGMARQVVGYQLIKAATSAAANYRAACIARSRADFVHKLGIVEEEAEESTFWIDFAADAALTKRQVIESLLKEGCELVAIVVQSRKTAKSGLAPAAQPRRQPPSIGNRQSAIGNQQ